MKKKRFIDKTTCSGHENIVTQKLLLYGFLIDFHPFTPIQHIITHYYHLGKAKKHE